MNYLFPNNSIKDLLSDLEAEGIDPNATPKERDRIEKKNAKDGCIVIFLLIALITIFFLIAFAITKWII